MFINVNLTNKSFFFLVKVSTRGGWIIKQSKEIGQCSSRITTNEKWFLAYSNSFWTMCDTAQAYFLSFKGVLEWNPLGTVSVAKKVSLSHYTLGNLLQFFLMRMMFWAITLTSKHLTPEVNSSANLGEVSKIFKFPWEY